MHLIDSNSQNVGVWKGSSCIRLFSIWKIEKLLMLFILNKCLTTYVKVTTFPHLTGITSLIDFYMTFF